jgi:hypothetical protein
VRPLDERQQFRRQIDGDIHLARRQRGSARGVLLDRAKNQGPDALRPAPPLIVGLQHDSGIRHVLDKAERAGSDRSPPITVEPDLPDIGRRHHVGQGHLRRQHRVGPPGDEPHREVVENIDSLDPGMVRLGRRHHGRIIHGVVKEFDCARIERFAIVELDALAQRQLPGQRVDVLPTRGEPRHRNARRLPSQQRVGDVIHQRAVRHGDDHVQCIQPDHIRPAGDDDALLRRPRSAGRKQRPHRECDSERFHRRYHVPDSRLPAGG